MKVYKECCKNCLLSADAIVSSKRRKDIIQTCAIEQRHFVCHKASLRGDEDICCKSYYDKLGHTSQLVRIAQRLDAVEFVDQPEAEKLPTYKETNK
jgi:hypothetical protein